MSANCISCYLTGLSGSHQRITHPQSLSNVLAEELDGSKHRGNLADTSPAGTPDNNCACSKPNEALDVTNQLGGGACCKTAFYQYCTPGPTRCNTRIRTEGPRCSPVAGHIQLGGPSWDFLKPRLRVRNRLVVILLIG